MLGRDDIVPMLLNVILIISGVIIVCMAGSLPDESLSRHVTETASAITRLVAFAINTLIALGTYRIASKLYQHKKRYVCVGCIAAGVGMIIVMENILLPLAGAAFEYLGNIFIGYVSLISK